MLLGCSTTPSITVMQPVIKIKKLVVKPPRSITTLCDPLLHYESTDARDVIKVTVRNNNIYFLCASKMKSAVSFIQRKK